MVLLVLACSDYTLNAKDDVAGDLDSGITEDSEGYREKDGPTDLAKVEECIVEPHVGTWTPQIEWNNTAPGDTYTTPVVGNLTDDNGDGVITTEDTPDIAVVNINGTVFVLSGANGQVIWQGGNLGFEPQTAAIADVDGDGRPDVVASGVNGTTAFRGENGQVIWSTPQVSGGNTAQCGAVGLYDLDGNGTVEVVVGNLILNGADGTLRGRGVYGSGAGHAWAAPMGVAADVDQDGDLEVVVGNALYDANGQALWYNGQTDGFVAVGNFDDDPKGEIVVAYTGTLRLQDDDGKVIWSRPGLTGSTIGPPTVADFNNDGEPEIGVAGNGIYVVVDKNGNELWRRPTVDYSSGFTGSSVFDFEGDGVAEVVYADENDVWVFNGINGEVRMKESRHSSATCSEYPAIADVDNDGQAEIIFASGAYSGSETGVTVIGDANNSWQASRPVWNQHGYAITNVSPDATVPAQPDTNWKTFNTFRSGDILAGQRGEYPDLVVQIDDVCQELCGEGTVVVYGRVGNQGVVPVDQPVDVSLFAVTPDGHLLLTSETITPPLNPGRLLPTLTFQADVSGLDVRALVLAVDGGNNAEGVAAECNEDNNQDVWAAGVCE